MSRAERRRRRRTGGLPKIITAKEANGWWKAQSTVKPYRDPFMDHLPAILEQVKRESVGAPAVKELTVDQALKALILDAYREPCLICDHKPDTVNVFVVPVELAKFNQRVIFYTLCQDCKLDIATRDKVTDKLTGQLKEENARMGVA